MLFKTRRNIFPITHYSNKEHYYENSIFGIAIPILVNEQIKTWPKLVQ